jgi:two-component system chemotaxis response regulator CheB
MEGTQERRSRVLIVDNSPVMRKIISDVVGALPRLEIVGQAGDGIEALAAVEKLQPDILILDIQMPRMNGLEVLKRLPKDKCKVIMLSAHADEMYVEKCLELRASHFFDKLNDFPGFVELVTGL